MWKFHKLQRGACLALFVTTSIASYFKPHLISVAGLSLIGVIAYDIICYLRVKSAPKDFGPDIEVMKEQHAATYQMIKEMKDDVGVAKLANSFRSR